MIHARVGPGHGSALVGVALALVVEDDAGYVVLATELDFGYEEVLVATVVNDTAADTTAVDEDAVGVPLGRMVEDAVG